MTTQQYKSLTEKEKIFADLLTEIVKGLKELQADIRDDLEATLRQ